MVNLEQTGLFSALLAAGVEFAVVGGVAVNVHGFSRATRDLDVFIRPTESNAKAAFAALEAAGAPTAGLSWQDLLNDEDHFRFGISSEYVDILSSIGDMPFEEVWLEHIEVEVDGLLVPFISKACLLKNKRATGRLRDLLDVEELELIPEVG